MISNLLKNFAGIFSSYLKDKEPAEVNDEEQDKEPAEVNNEALDNESKIRWTGDATDATAYLSPNSTMDKKLVVNPGAGNIVIDPSIAENITIGHNNINLSVENILKVYEEYAKILGLNLYDENDLDTHAVYVNGEEIMTGSESKCISECNSLIKRLEVNNYSKKDIDVKVRKLTDTNLYDKIKRWDGKIYENN